MVHFVSMLITSADTEELVLTAAEHTHPMALRKAPTLPVHQGTTQSWPHFSILAESSPILPRRLRRGGGAAAPGLGVTSSGPAPLASLPSLHQFTPLPFPVCTSSHPSTLSFFCYITSWFQSAFCNATLSTRRRNPKPRRHRSVVTNERDSKKQHGFAQHSQPHNGAVAAACEPLGTAKNSYLRSTVILHFAAQAIADNPTKQSP